MEYKEQIIYRGKVYKYSGHGDLYVNRDGSFIRKNKNGTYKKARLTDTAKDKPYVAVAYMDDNGKHKLLKAMNIVYDIFVEPIKNKHAVFTKAIDGNSWNLNADNIMTYNNNDEGMIEKRNLTVWRDTSVPGLRCSRDGRFIGKFHYRIKLHAPNKYVKHAHLYVNTGKMRTHVNAAREVYDAWIGKSDINREEVIAKDGNAMNLNAENLIAVSRSELQSKRAIEYFKSKATAEEVLKALSIRKTEIDLAIYFCTTGKFDRYNEYVNNTLYKRLYDYGANHIRGGAISNENVMDYTAEAIAVLYELIDKNRGISDLSILGKKIMLRLSKKYKRKMKYEYGIKSIRRPVDEINFAELAKKYGLTKYI